MIISLLKKYQYHHDKKNGLHQLSTSVLATNTCGRSEDDVPLGAREQPGGSRSA